jgi:hypothetical protein
MAPPMTSVTMWMPAELLASLDVAAAERHATRSALIRGVLEDAVDSGELPERAMTTAELLAELRDAELDRLRELSRG